MLPGVRDWAYKETCEDAFGDEAENVLEWLRHEHETWR
jgi:hypothetical protein